MAAASNASFNAPSQVLFVEPSFGIVDYVVFSLFLCLSGAIGIFFSCRGQKTTNEYFFGNRKMSAIPIGISTGVSFMSALSTVGNAAETFKSGYSFSIIAFTGVISAFTGLSIVASIIHPLRIKSLNEYYHKRFRSRSITITANIMVLACIFHYMGTCMFGAVLAFNSATGGQVSIVVALVIGCSVGVFYTTIGGLKAVIWTDVLQFGIMIAGIVTVIIKSIIDTPGGVSTILEMNKKYGRLEIPSLSPNPTIRHSMWSLTIGSAMNWMCWSTQPAIIQRFCSMERKRDCFIIAAITGSLYGFFSLLPSLAGVNIFGYYASKGCDVFTAGWIKKNDILLYFIRDRIAFPGFQGLFVASLYAGSLSSLSSGLNSASSIIWNDLIRPCFKREPSELRATLICKIIVVVFGVLAMMWSYLLVSFQGMMMQIVMSLDASMYGAYFSLFALAITFRFISSKGAVAGVLFSFAFTLWLGLSSLLYGKSHVAIMDTTTETCAQPTNLSSTMITPTQPLLVLPNATCPTQNDSSSFFISLYSVSYLWFATICVLTSAIIALWVTACTKSRGKVDPALLLSSKCPKCCAVDDASDASSSDEMSDEKRKLADSGCDDVIVLGHIVSSAAS